VLTVNLIYFLFGAAIASGLVAIGIALGFSQGKRRGAPAKSEVDRHVLLEMLHELGDWTTEYSGNITEYQARIGELSELAKKTVVSPNKTDGGVAGLLSDIMQTNAHVQQRLEAAERQLEKQTQQIESYLTEARTDGLTKLANRRSFDAKIEELFTAYRKGGKSFVLAMLDIDHFKKINDTYGHPVGDEVLRQVSSILRQSIDTPYLIARYGGEEFAILMTGPLRLAADRVDLMRKRLAAEPLRLADRLIPVTLSAGLTEPRDEVAVATMIRRADESLYAAKNIGRNRVYYHDGRQAMLVGAPEVASNTSG
jgi:diguanylate cyclase